MLLRGYGMDKAQRSLPLEEGRRLFLLELAVLRPSRPNLARKEAL